MPAADDGSVILKRRSLTIWIEQRRGGCCRDAHQREQHHSPDGPPPKTHFRRSIGTRSESIHTNGESYPRRLNWARSEQGPGARGQDTGISRPGGPSLSRPFVWGGVARWASKTQPTLPHA